MTTIVGIKAEKNGSGVVLASDISRTQTSWDQYGDVAHRRQTRSEGQKIYVSEDRSVAIAMSGVFDEAYTKFLASVLKGEISLRGPIDSNRFDEFLKLNLSRWAGKLPGTDYINGLLVATRYDNQPRLHTCWPLGFVEERTYTAIGSGSDFALAHIASTEKLIPSQLNLKSAVELSAESLDRASKDIYTGGIDLVVVTADGIQEYGNKIKDNLKVARETVIRAIAEEVNKI